MNSIIIRATAVVCVAFVAACSSTPSVSKLAGRPDAMIRLDARPGEYQMLRGALDTTDAGLPEPIRFEFEFQKLQPSDRWFPTLNLCVYAGSDEQVTCLKVNKYHNERHLVPEMQVKIDGPSAYQKKETKFLLEANSTHTVDVRFSGNLVTFTLDGRALHEQEVAVVPSAYYLACSSAVCGVNIYQPPDRP